MNRGIRQSQGLDRQSSNTNGGVTGLQRLVCAFLFVSISLTSSGHPLDQWFWRNPLPQANSLLSVTFGDGRFLAVGEAGTVITSTEGIEWNQQKSGTINSLAHVAYYEGKFLAVGEKGTILTSTNSLDWSPVPSGVANDLKSIAYGNGAFVIVGHQGTVLRSTTGSNWTKQSGVAASLWLQSVAFGAGVFVAISSVGDVIRSTDGISWTSQPRIGGYPKQIAYVNNRFVIVDSSMRFSEDGITWSSVWVNPAPVALIYEDGQYVGVGGSGIVQVSSNGTNWSWVTAFQSSRDLNAIAFGHDRYVAVGALGTIRTSSDRNIWTTRSQALTNGGELGRVRFLNGEFVAVGDGAIGPGGILEKSPILFSGSSTKWYRRDFGFNYLQDITYGGAKYILVTSFGIVASKDGINWEARSSGLPSQLAAITYANGLFVLTGWGGAISTSPDGDTWTPRTSGSTRNLWDVTYGKGLFVAVGQSFSSTTGAILTSGDGVTWTNRNAANLRAVTFGNDLFVAVGDNGHIRTSPDAITWVTRSSGTTSRLLGVTHGHGHFVAVGDAGMLLTSPDGSMWTLRNLGTSVSLKGVASGKKSFVVVGDGSTILESASTVPTVRLVKQTDSSGIELNLIGGLNRTYIVESTSNLASDPWSYLTTILPGQRTVTDLDSSSLTKFYRVAVP